MITDEDIFYLGVLALAVNAAAWAWICLLLVNSATGFSIMFATFLMVSSMGAVACILRYFYDIRRR